jgi:serine protease inhibitor
MMLNQTLKQMGMEQAFHEGDADFSKIRKENALFVDQVLHKTFVEVNEKGTEASAVTVVVMKQKKGGMSFNFSTPPFHMTLNRSFVFLIVEKKSNAIVFIGKIIEPNGAKKQNE